MTPEEKKRREAVAAFYRLMREQKVKHETDDLCKGGCLYHAWPWDEGWRCPFCEDKRMLRRAMLEVLGFWAARVNRLIEAALIRAEPEYKPRKVDTSIPTTRECKALLERFRRRHGLEPGGGSDPWATDEQYGSWSRVVRLYEDENY